MDKKKSFTTIVAENHFIQTIISVILGFLVGAIFLLIMGLSVGDAYGRLITSITSVKGISYVIVYSIPYIMTGLSVAFSFKTGMFNIGAEGQFVMGSMAAAVVGILLPDLPKPILIPLCFLAAALVGALWAGLVGILKTTRGINEVLAMIMTNWVAFYLSNFIAGIPAIHSEGTANATRNISENAQTLLSDGIIKKLGLCPTANWGILVSLIMVVVIWVVINKTTLGYRLKAVGANKSAAEYGGINVNRSILTALAISGALAGLGGALQIMGMGNRISVFSSQEGFGFAGIVVALMGCSNPFGVLAAGIFYGALIFGGSKLNLVGAPTQLVNVIIGTVVLFIAISVVFERLKYVKSKKEKNKTPAAAKADTEVDKK